MTPVERLEYLASEAKHATGSSSKLATWIAHITKAVIPDPEAIAVARKEIIAAVVEAVKAELRALVREMIDAEVNGGFTLTAGDPDKPDAPPSPPL